MALSNAEKYGAGAVDLPVRLALQWIQPGIAFLAPRAWSLYTISQERSAAPAMLPAAHIALGGLVTMSLSQRFEEALRWAAQLHAGQVRKDTAIPYIAHPLAVASLALEQGAGEDEAIAALLHDAIEDQGGAGTGEEIRRRFGEGVASIVVGCTDTHTTPRPPWRERKEAYLAHLPAASAAIRLVSACDKLHNARAILADYRQLGEPLWQRFSGRKEGVLWYYRSLVRAFEQAGPAPLAEELDRVVSEIERLALA